jgi:hypothetical protein
MVNIAGLPDVTVQVGSDQEPGFMQLLTEHGELLLP